MARRRDAHARSLRWLPMPDACPSSNAFSEQFVLGHQRDEVEAAERAILDAVARLDYDRAASFGIRLALEEALSNAFRHGNKDDPAKTVRLKARVDPRTVVIEVEDQGEGFDPESVPDPTEQENVEIPSGRGLTLMRAFMTRVRILPPGNRVEMTFVRPD
jgi:serine/threonine-protein kinase RsbW